MKPLGILIMSWQPMFYDAATTPNAHLYCSFLYLNFQKTYLFCVYEAAELNLMDYFFLKTGDKKHNNVSSYKGHTYLIA